MLIKNVPKEKRFYEYLLELTKLTGKVIRDYRDYERHWDPIDLRDIDGCFVAEDCEDVDTFLEIYKPKISELDKTPPAPFKILEEWLSFNINNENALPKYEEQKRYKDEHGEEQHELFKDDNERVKLYANYVDEWKFWAVNLANKKKLSKLYNEFFELVSQFDKEGESIELIFGRGILKWNHPDKRIGLINSPLLTQKLELNLDIERNVITAIRIDEISNVEREMLSGVNLPNKNKVEEILNRLNKTDITDDISEMLMHFISMIDADGEYKKPGKSIVIRDTPVIHDENIFIFRVKNTRVIRDDLESIIDLIDSGELEMNEAIKSLIGEEVESIDIENKENNNLNPELPTNALFFPLESNEQQKEIVKRIENNFGVTVQGPPGTGKTHTIANLVSHYLAEGKRVLITSQKENPLRVLKDKIPKEIQDLCVPVLGGGRDSLQEIERSINTISEKLGELDTNKLSEHIKRNLKYLDESKRKESRLINQLKDYVEKEGSVLNYKSDELFRYDVAKILSQSDINYEWIIDKVELNEEFPVNEVEFKELWRYRDNLSAEDLKLHSSILPVIDKDIRNNNSFKEFINRGNKLEQFKAKGFTYLESYQLPSDISALDELITSLNVLIESKLILENQGFISVLNDLRAGDSRKDRWIKLVENAKESCNQLFVYYNKLITHEIDLPNKGLSEIKEDVKVAKERLESGKKPNLTFFLLKGKQTKYLFETPVLNDKSIGKVEDLKLIEDHIKYQELKAETARIFNGNIQEINHSSLDKEESRFPHMLEERLKELDTVLEVFKTMNDLEGKIVNSNIDLFSYEEVCTLQENIMEAKLYLEYKDWLKLHEEELTRLKLFGEGANSHSIIYEITEAFVNRDINNWEQLLNKLIGLYETKKDVHLFYDLLYKLDENLPLTRKSIEMSVGDTWTYPTGYLLSFEQKKLGTWLDQTKNIDATNLRGLIEKEKDYQRELIQNIVRDSSWKSQIERITEKEKRALSSWKTYIKRYGKGTGKNRKYLKSAREAMKDAQSAIPVWIMPVTQVLENFPITNEKFDVVIFDESSQCDIFSANVLLRGKKMIVVGDDEQISPQAIGINQDDVDELVRRLIPDIPNSDLFDGNISLYEIAEQTFPKAGKLMLREHFRCVPEIIQFSNDLSYGGEMIPLRLPLEEEKLEPPVMAIKVKDGYNDALEKDINQPEAEAIVDDIYDMVNDPKYNDQTIGVITLQGNKQHKLLENLIRDKIGDAEFVARKIICGNAYDLQGDERDIIFLSMVIAPNRNFRSLSMNRDKQRYNVAASRAKNQMRLYHSVDTSDLKNNDLRYSLLSYCKNPTRVNKAMEDLEQLCDSPFEIDVLRMIIAKGYKVTPQLKVGNYRIDFVIEGMRDRLAVECDGEKWHGPEKFEEDMQRQGSLERAGWTFWRVRGRDFYFNPNKAMESLWTKLSEMGIESNIFDEKTSEIQEEQTVVIAQEEKSPEKEVGMIDSHDGKVSKGTQLKTSTKESVAEVQQMNLLSEVSNDDLNNSLVSTLEARGLDVIDKRNKNGNLWVVGGSELSPVFNEFTKKGIKFKFAPNGSRSTNKLPGWYMSDSK